MRQQLNWQRRQRQRRPQVCKPDGCYLLSIQLRLVIDAAAASRPPRIREQREQQNPPTAPLRGGRTISFAAAEESPRRAAAHSLCHTGDQLAAPTPPTPGLSPPTKVQKLDDRRRQSKR